MSKNIIEITDKQLNINGEYFLMKGYRLDERDDSYTTLEIELLIIPELTELNITNKWVKDDKPESI